MLKCLRAENARLIALLDTHGIEWRLPDEPLVDPASSAALLSSSFDTAAKLALFKRLFRGRVDVFARLASKARFKAGWQDLAWFVTSVEINRTALIMGQGARCTT